MSRKYFIFFTIIYLFLSSNVFAQTSTDTTVKDDSVKYPQWALDLRRADIIAFGAFPFSWIIATTIIDLYRSSTHNWDLRYAPWPVTAAAAVPRTNEEFITIIGISAGISIGLALADFIIIKIKRARAKAKTESLPKGDPIIIRRDLKTGEVIEESQEVPDNPDEEIEIETKTEAETNGELENAVGAEAE